MYDGAALVAADGAASFIRQSLGLQLVGHQKVANIVNCYFRADIEPHLRGRRGVLLFVANERANGVLQALDGRGRWLCQITVTPDDWSLERFTPERAAQWVRDAAGIDDLDVEVLSIGLWQLNATVVERLVQGRVLLCGDAAHQFPPTGGLGVNTGLQGMHNAMWKLAWHVHGYADWSLVETYETERRPVSERITSQSFENSINVGRIRAAISGDSTEPLPPEQIVIEGPPLRQPPRRRVRLRATPPPPSSPTAPHPRRSTTTTPTTCPRRHPAPAPHTTGSAAPTAGSPPSI